MTLLSLIETVMLTFLSWADALIASVKRRWTRAEVAGPVPVQLLAAPATGGPKARATTPDALAPVRKRSPPRLALVHNQPAPQAALSFSRRNLRLVKTATSASALVVSLASSTVSTQPARAARTSRNETFIAGRDARVYSLDHYRGAHPDRGTTPRPQGA